MLQALALQEFVFRLQFGEPLGQLFLNGLGGALHPTGGGDVVAGRINGDFVQPAHHLAPERVDLGNCIDRIAEEFDSDRPALLIGRKDLDHIAPHPKRAAMKIKVVALVLNIDQLTEQRVPVHLAALFDKEDEIKIGFGRPQPIDARDAGNDDGIAPFQQRLGGGVAHLVDFLVNRGVFLHIGIALGDVGFGLVVIVITDEVAHRIVREDVLEFIIELGRQGFIGRHHQCRPVQPCNDMGHGKGFARAGHTEQNLMGQSVLQALGKLIDGLGLVALGLKVRDEFESGVSGHVGAS